MAVVAAVEGVRRGGVTAALVLDVGLDVPFLLLGMVERAPGRRALVLAFVAGHRPVHVRVVVDLGVAVGVRARVPVVAVLDARARNRLVPPAGDWHVGQLAVLFEGGPPELAHRVRVPALISLTLVAALLLGRLLAEHGLCVGHHAGAALDKERHDRVVGIERLRALELGFIKRNELFNQAVGKIVYH